MLSIFKRNFSTKIIKKGTSGSKLIMEYLELQGVNKNVAAFTGGAIMKLTDEFFDNKYFNYIMARTENSAGFIANGIAKSTDNIAVCLGTSGPGSSHLVSSIYNASTDGNLVLAITANVATANLGTDAFQEIDSIALTKKITKFNFQPHDVDILDKMMYITFKTMLSERPGPVHLDIPKDILTAKITKDIIIKKYIKNNKIYFPVNKKQIIIENNFKKYYKIIDLIMNAKKPVILLGNGAFDANKEVDKLLKITKIPVTTTLHALNMVDERDDLSLKLLGMHGSYAANNAVQNCDLLINIGARLDDRVSCNIDKFNPSKDNCNIINFEIDFKEQKRKKKLFNPDINLMGDCKDHLKTITNRLLRKEIPDYNDWKKYILKLKNQYPFSYKKSTNQFELSGQQIITTLNDITNKINKNLFISTGVGNHQFATAQFWTWGTKNKGEKMHITSGSSGDMNFGVNATIGVALSNPDKLCLSIEGDGCANMTLNGWQTITDYKLKNIKVIIFDDNSQEMVRCWQKLFMNGRIISTTHENPDYCLIGRAMGLKSFYIDNQINLYKTLSEAINYKGSCIIHCKIKKNGFMTTLIKPSRGLDEMIFNFDCDPDCNVGIDEDVEEAPC